MLLGCWHSGLLYVSLIKGNLLPAQRSKWAWDPSERILLSMRNLLILHILAQIYLWGSKRNLSDGNRSLSRNDEATAMVVCGTAHHYKLAVLTFITQHTSSPQYLSQHISLRTSARNTRSSSLPLLCVPFRRTSFSRRSFSTAASLTWNSLPHAVLNCDSFSTFKSTLKTHLFSTALC